MHLPRAYSGERGSSALFIFVGLLIVVGIATGLVQYNKSTRYQLTQSVAKMEIDSALMSVHGGIRAALLEYPADDCMPSAFSANKLKSYRIFEPDKHAELIEFELNEAGLSSERLGCLLSKAQVEKISSLKIKISPLQELRDGLLRKVEVVVEITSKAKSEKFARRVKLARLYQFQPLSISRFGLTFMKDLTEGTFITLTGDQTKLRVFSNVFYAGSSSPALTQLLPPTPERLMFDRGNFARFRAVQTFGQNINNFRLTFRNGLQTSALPQPFVPEFLPTAGNENWEQRFDYYPQYSLFSYPIPEILRDGSPTASTCGDGGTTFDASRASIDTVPTTGKGPENSSQTCERGVANQTFVFINAKSNLTVKLGSTDRNFCGMVVADTLTVEIDSEDPLTYGLIGNFYVNRLVIKNVKKLNEGFSEVRMYNPTDGVAFEGLAPLGQTVDQLSTGFRELASSTARNFYLPIASSKGFKPWRAEEYLRPCPTNPAVFSYFPSYDPFFQLGAFAPYLADQAGSIYALESF
ncbi:MAG: hypothetical protein EOP11_03835 [Proteobacteria bacterium]|nr:MAG: hypothetical protein EOP11_03835 [Pseudomonadota bacterium]